MRFFRPLSTTEYGFLVGFGIVDLIVLLPTVVIAVRSLCVCCCRRSDPRRYTTAAGDSEAEPSLSASAAPTPYLSAGLFSRLTFAWLSPLLAQGYKRPLEQVTHPVVLLPPPPWWCCGTSCMFPVPPKRSKAETLSWADGLPSTE